MSVAYHLKGKDYVLFEKLDRVGGLCRSETTDDGFTFDYGGHIMFTKDNYIKALYKKLLKKDALTQKRKAWIYSKGIYTRYPFQANTYGLPVGVVKECLVGLVDAKSRGRLFPGLDPLNFKDWIYANFGEGIAKHFMLPYNEKLWAIDLGKMSYAWIQGKVLAPDLEEAIEGALTDQKKEFGPNATYVYPKQGMEALPRVFLECIDKNKVNCNSEIIRINWKAKEISFKDCSGTSYASYEKLAYTLPLPLLEELMEPELPSDVREAVGRLEYNRLYCLNFAVEEKRWPDKVTVYIPERDFLMHRVIFAFNKSSSLVPEGWGSLSVEVSESRYKPIPKGMELMDRVMEDLKKAKIISPTDNIMLKSVFLLDPAYIIYTQTHRKDVDLIHAFLRDNDIYPCGRFGDWEYLNMDEAILSGRRVAECIQ